MGEVHNAESQVAVYTPICVHVSIAPMPTWAITHARPKP